MDNPIAAPAPNSRKRQRADDVSGPPVSADAFVADPEAGESGGDDDDDDDKKGDKKAGRRKIKIEFIADKSRRHITFSKRKAGIMKKAYELSTLTGTQVLLLVVSETGLVYTFTTAKLQPLVTQPEGKNLIQACLNAPQGSHPSHMPVGAPIGRSTGPVPGGPMNNVPGGLSIGNKEEDPDDKERAADGARPSLSGPDEKRRRRSSTTQGNASANNASAAPGGSQSPHPSPSAPLATPPAAQAVPSGSPSSQPAQPPGGQPGPQGAPYGHHPGHYAHQGSPTDPNAAAMYAPHMMAPQGYYPPPPGTQMPPQHGGQPHGHWGQVQPVNPSQYRR